MTKHQKEIDAAHALISEASKRLGEAVKTQETVGIKAAHALQDSGNKTLAEHLPKLAEASSRLAAGH